MLPFIQDALQSKLTKMIGSMSDVEYAMYCNGLIDAIVCANVKDRMDKKMVKFKHNIEQK